MKGFEITKNGGSKPLRIGVEDGLPLIIFAVDGRGHEDFHATVTEYETGDRYRYALEDMVSGDEFEICYTAFDEPSAPIALEKKGTAPLRRRVVDGTGQAAGAGVAAADDDAGMAPMAALQANDSGACSGPEHATASPALEVSLNGRSVQSSLPGSVLISDEHLGLQVSYCVFSDDGAMHSLLKTPLRLGDVLRVRFSPAKP